jgi:hypothetical protein
MLKIKMIYLILYVSLSIILQVHSQDYSIDTFKISWKDNGDSTNITMTNTMTKYNWFAFGLSNDQFMVILLKLNRF